MSMELVTYSMANSHVCPKNSKKLCKMDLNLNLNFFQLSFKKNEKIKWQEFSVVAPPPVRPRMVNILNLSFQSQATWYYLGYKTAALSWGTGKNINRSCKHYHQKILISMIEKAGTLWLTQTFSKLQTALQQRFQPRFARHQGNHFIEK